MSPPSVASQLTVPGQGVARGKDLFGRPTVLSYEVSLRKNRFVLHDLNARSEVADETLPLRECAFLEELPEVGEELPEVGEELP